MAVNILLKRSATASKRPVGASMAFGELNLNYDAATGGLYYKNSNGDVVKVGPCQVSATAPNSSPAGSSGNSAGEFWYDSSTNTLKLYDGTAWVEAGGSVQGVTGTAPITVDNTDPLNPVIGIDAASTTAPGAVQLNDSTSSSSTTEALTANQGRILQTQIDALAVSSNLTFAGTIDASTGDMITVSTEGAANGFVIGDPLPSPAAGNSEFFVIVTVPGTMTPPGGVSTECHQGDWWLSDGTAWNFLDVGYNAPYATTAVPGIVQLATDAEVQAGLNLDHAVTPSGLQSKVSDSVSTTSSTTLASSTAVKSAYDAAVSANDLASSAFDAAGLAQADANQALLDAAAAQATADAAMPKAGGTFTGNVTFDAGTTVTLDTGSNFLVDGSNSFSGSTNFEGTSTTTFLTGSTVTFESQPTLETSLVIGTAGTSYELPVADGAANYILSTDGAGTVSWVANAVDGVQSVSGTSPITIDNTDPANPIVEIDAASTTAAGAVQLNNTVTSTSTTEAATANAVKIAYDEAVAAAGADPFASSNVLFVNPTTGNNTTAARGTAKPYATLTAALAAASDGDFIYMAPGTYIENPVISKGVTILGTYQDLGTWQGTKIQGNTQLSLSASVTRNCAIYNVYFISTNSTPPFEVIAHANSAAGNTIIANCGFTQATSSDVNQFAFRTAVATWARAIYTRNCLFDGNVKHNAGTAAGASGYLVMDNTIGAGSSSFYYHILTGTVEFRNPSQALSPIFQAGGVVSTSNVLGFTSNSATTTTIFGGTGFNYKGSAASVGTGTVYFGAGYNTAAGKIDIGANLVYGWTNLNVTPANLTISGSAVPYTTAVPASANVVVAQQTRPQYNLLTSTSSVTAANQLSTVVDSATGILYTVAALDAGTY